MSAPKPKKLEPKLPRGFSDRGPADIRATERMMATIKAVYERYGFEPVETPFVEYTEALGKFLPDQDRPNEGVFSFQDEDDSWLSLRYDLTAPLARYVAQIFDTLPKPYRSYRAGWVFRNEKPGPGRFRQFMQFDADTVGASSPAADAEICMMAADTMEALGFSRGQYVIKVNNRKILDGVMEAAGIGDSTQRLHVLRSVDKRDRVGDTGVRQLLGEGRKDESGDFTRGAGLRPDQIDLVMELFRFGVVRPTAQFSFDLKRPSYVARAEEKGIVGTRAFKYGFFDNLYLAFARNDTIERGIEELFQIELLVDLSGYQQDQIDIDVSVARGLEYYTGPVFEAQLTFEVPNEKGEPVVFGSVGGGGRYDGLVGRFRGEEIPATGFSVGVSRLAAALKAVGKLGDDASSGPVVVTVMDRQHLAEYQQITAMLRDELNRERKPGQPIIPVEMYLGDSKKLGAQLKYADRRNAPCAIIAGSNEFAAGKIQIKDLAAGKQQAAAIASHEEWREERPGQFEVPRGELVAEVRKLLARQKGG